MSKFNISKLEYAYTVNGLIHISQAKRGFDYFLDKGMKIPLVYCEGSKVVPYWRKYANISDEMLQEVFGSSESVEHYNAKMRLSMWKTIRDYSFGLEFKPSYSKTEYYIKSINKIVDIAYFDSDDEILLCMEVYNTNKKTQSDIDKFNQEDIIVYEYDIKKERCYAISAGKVNYENRAVRRSRIKEGRKHIHRVKREIKQIEGREERKRFKELCNEYYQTKARIEQVKSDIRWLKKELSQKD